MGLILSRIRLHLGLYCAGIFFLSVEAASDLLQPAMMSRIVDEGVKRQDPSAVLFFGGLMLLTAFIGAFGAVMRSVLASRTSQLIGKELRSLLYRKIQSYSFSDLDRLPPATLITRLTNDVTQIQNFVNSSMRILVKSPLTCAGAVFFIVARTPRQAPVLLVILAVCALLIFGNMAMGYPRFGRVQEKLDRLNAVSRGFLSSIRAVKAFGREDAEERRFGAAAGELSRAAVSANRVSALFTPLINLTVNTGIVALIWLADLGEIRDVGRLMASVNYMTQVLLSLSMLSGILNMMARASASAGRVQEALDAAPAARPSAGAPFRNGAVSFQDVSFAYGKSRRYALRRVSFLVEKGATLGIIGPTGAGKTTLVNLLPRFYDAAEGAVRVAGADVRDLDPASLRKGIAIVPQKAVLFSGAIRDNLRWGDADAPEDALLSAAAAAKADGFITGFPAGYDTVLGQGGVNLSGGQKQRICIARALVRKPAILILDDCTSALDAATEAAVLDGIRAHSAGATVLLVSQRVSTVMRADRILCMDQGRVRGWGTHRELMAHCAVYREIYRSQMGGGANG